MYNNFLNHVTTFLKGKEEWSIAYRSTIITRGHKTNNIVESSIHIFKDIVLERCKAFNVGALVDLVATVLENYHKRRLLKYAAGSRASKPELHFQKFCIQTKGLQVDKVNDNLFYVNSFKNENIVYSVHIDTGVCDCPVGQGGKFCKHQYAVFLREESLT